MTVSQTLPCPIFHQSFKQRVPHQSHGSHRFLNESQNLMTFFYILQLSLHITEGGSIFKTKYLHTLLQKERNVMYGETSTSKHGKCQTWPCTALAVLSDPIQTDLMHVLHANVDGVNSTLVKSSLKEFSTVSVFSLLIHLFENIWTHCFKQAQTYKLQTAFNFCLYREKKGFVSYYK